MENNNVKNYMDQFTSPEDFIRHQICRNKGTQNLMDKSVMIALAQTNGAEVNDKMTKEELYAQLRKVVPLEEIAAECEHLGVASISYQRKFGITNTQLRSMAKSGFIQITGTERFRSYGAYREANLYSVFDYFRLTQADVDTWLQAHKSAHRKTDTTI